jgi:chromosome segregation ATPase
VVCSEAKQKQNSCKNIDTIELQLIEKNSQLKEAQKALSLAKINVAVLLDEKERANKAITTAKNLAESLKIVEEKLYSSQQDLQKSLNSQTELSNIVTVKSGIVESLNNKLKIIEKDIATTKNDLSASIKDNEINTSELSQTTEKLITALKQLRSTELELKISEIKLSNISNTKTDQNKRIMSNSIDRVKKSKENKGVNFSVYLTGFSEEEINDYCLSIKDSATQDVEAFGIIISSDEEAKSTYKKLCVETNLDN